MNPTTIEDLRQPLQVTLDRGPDAQPLTCVPVAAWKLPAVLALAKAEPHPAFVRGLAEQVRAGYHEAHPWNRQPADLVRAAECVLEAAVACRASRLNGETPFRTYALVAGDYAGPAKDSSSGEWMGPYSAGSSWTIVRILSDAALAAPRACVEGAAWTAENEASLVGDMASLTAFAIREPSITAGERAEMAACGAVPYELLLLGAAALIRGPVAQRWLAVSDSAASDAHDRFTVDACRRAAAEAQHLATRAKWTIIEGIEATTGHRLHGPLNDGPLS